MTILPNWYQALFASQTALYINLGFDLAEARTCAQGDISRACGLDPQSQAEYSKDWDESQRDLFR